MKTRIVPAIDLLEGRCVRLTQGNFDTAAVVADDPLVLARRFTSLGFGRLHLVDLSGARAGVLSGAAVLQRIVSETGLEVDFSGGVRSFETLQEVIRDGARYVVLGSAAVRQRSEVQRWVAEIGAERIMLALDVLDGTVRVSGWREDTGLSLDEVLNGYLELGVGRLMVTDISRDGMLSGPAVGLYRGLRARYPGVCLVASGGVTTAADVRALEEVGVDEIIVGKALYNGGLDLSQVGECIW